MYRMAAVRRGLSKVLQLALFVLLCQCTFDLLVPSQEWLLRPSAGRNDGTDQGSESGGKDTYTFGLTPDANYGAEVVAIGQPESDCNNATGVAYVQFDVSSLPEAEGRVLLGLTPYPHAGSCQSNCVIDVYFYLVAEPWDEIKVTFNHAPELGASILGPIHIDGHADFQPREFDISAVARDWQRLNLPNYGLAFTSPTVGCNDGSAHFGFYTSDEPDIRKRPYLRFSGLDGSVSRPFQGKNHG